MSEKDLFKDITKEEVLKAITTIDDEGYPSNRKSSTYDLVYEGTNYPPKYIISLAGYFANEHFISHKEFSGGEDSACFTVLRDMGFTILPKTETNQYSKAKDVPNVHLKYTYKNINEELDLDKLKSHFKEYLAYCNRSTWLFVKEKYKFKFARWLYNRVDFNNQSDEQILALCKESQQEVYYDDSSEKGINFILSALRYTDEFITLQDIKLFRKLHKGGLLEDFDLKDSPLSFPKFSDWIGTLLPEHYKPFGQKEMLDSITYLFNIEKYPKTGLRAFNLANTCLNRIAEEINDLYKQDLKEIIARLFPDDPVIKACDLSWLVQDFTLYLARRVMEKEVNYYWVNQGSSYDKEKEFGIIAAPNGNLHHHKRLKDLSEGDIIVHYSEGAVKATSTVSKEYEIGPRPYPLKEYSDQEVLIVHVKYSELSNPIPLDKIQETFSGNEGLLPSKYSPINRKFKINQSYCLNFTEEAYKLLFGDMNKNYWVFQGNPKIYDVYSALKDNAVKTWNVKAHKDKIKIGDKVILWVTGKQSGCYALAEVESDIYYGNEFETEKKYYTKESKKYYPEEEKVEGSDIVKLKVTNNLYNMPISWDEIKDQPAFKDFKGSNQGTNFSSTKEEYDKILKLAMKKTGCKYWLYSPGENAEKWEEFYKEGIMGLGWDDLGDLNQYESKDKIVEKLQELDGTASSKKNDATANYEFKNVMAVGDIVIVKKGRRELIGMGSVKSAYFFEEKREDFKHIRKVNWTHKGKWPVDHSMHVKTLTDISDYPTEDPNYNKYNEKLIGIIKGDQQDIRDMKQAVNTIFYGPPGTGKTFTLKDQYFEQYTSSETSITAEKHLENVVQKISWWEVIAIALLELKKAKVSAILEHPWVEKKAQLSNNSNIRQGLWGSLQTHTIESCEYVKYQKRTAPLIFNKTEDSYWEIVEDEVHELAPELFDLFNSVNEFQPNPDIQIERYEFVTFHQSYGYEDFIEGIKPIMPENGEEVGELGYKIEEGVFKRLCDRAVKDPENRYAIFIDEINRGNISQIFGELITLIEKDKRKEAAHELSAILPYSKKPFMVPSNLDIYGTMNTADRSVEALDTALRRRFSFLEMMPNPELLAGKTIEGISLRQVLQTINERVELLVDRDHTIGHSYFINVKTKAQLVEAFNDKIIPLLQEYFYGDFGKIGLVLGKGFVEVNTNNNSEFAAFDYEQQDDFKTSTYSLLKATEETIIDSIGLLLNTKSESSQD